MDTQQDTAIVPLADTQIDSNAEKYPPTLVEVLRKVGDIIPENLSKRLEEGGVIKFRITNAELEVNYQPRKKRRCLYHLGIAMTVIFAGIVGHLLTPTKIETIYIRSPVSDSMQASQLANATILPRLECTSEKIYNILKPYINTGKEMPSENIEMIQTLTSRKLIPIFLSPREAEFMIVQQYTTDHETIEKYKWRGDIIAVHLRVFWPLGPISVNLERRVNPRSRDDPLGL